ncbi:MAG: YkgJ family cysteine cluster protein [Alphaproteobacteria bacterium]|nr:YkgJ family cysteine cluster protein [Alphaproteobacteria bacterium]
MLRTHSNAQAPLRHRCMGCGGSCQSVHVSLFGDEPERIRALAAQLDVSEPVDEDNHLRKVDGACVFLDPGNLCRIHARFGPEAKPTVCRQFPIVAVRAEDGVRVGIDPSCYTAVQTWRDGPLAEEGSLISSKVSFEEGQARQEARLIEDLEAPGATVAGVLARLCGQAPPEDGGLPEGFGERLLERIRAGKVQEFVSGAIVGPQMAAALGPVLAHAVDSDAPGPWPVLSPEAEAWAIEATRRVVFLRLASVSLPSVAGVGLLMLSGAVLCGWTAPDTETFGHHLSGWIRALRFRPFWTRITPDPRTLSWLATGR